MRSIYVTFKISTCGCRQWLLVHLTHHQNSQLWLCHSLWCMSVTVRTSLWIWPTAVVSPLSFVICSSHWFPATLKLFDTSFKFSSHSHFQQYFFEKRKKHILHFTEHHICLCFAPELGFTACHTAASMVYQLLLSSSSFGVLAACLHICRLNK